MRCEDCNHIPDSQPYIDTCPRCNSIHSWQLHSIRAENSQSAIELARLRALEGRYG
jgi:hypothetical protein